MAYREFQNEKTYEAPVLETPKSLGILSQLQNQKARQQLFQQQKDAKDLEDIKKFHASTTIPKYDRLIQGEAENVTKSAQQDLIQSGVISPKTKLRMQSLQNLNSRGIAHREEMKRLLTEEHAKAAADKYYNPTINIERINKSIPYKGLSLEEELNSDETDISNNRGDIGHPQDIKQTFKHGEQLGDWMQTFKDKTKENTHVGANGIKTSTTMTSPFVNKNGIPDVTNKHVLEYLGSHPSVKSYYTNQAIEQMQNEITENKAHDPNWMAGMSEGDILSGMIDGQIKNPHPNATGNTRDAEDNIINKPLDLNDRIREMARNDIKSHAHILSKVDTDLSGSSSGYQYGANNKKTTIAQGFDNSDVSGMSLAINHNDKPITYPNLLPGKVYNLDDGRSQKNVDHKNFTANRYKIVIKDKDDNIIPLKATNYEDYVKELNTLPADKLKGASWTWAAEGQSVNKHNISSALDRLRKEPSTPEIQGLIDSLKKIQSGEESVDIEPLAVLKKQFGLDVVTNEMIPIQNENGKNDQAGQQLKSMTGVDLYSPKVMQGEFKDITNLIDNRVKQSTSPKEKAVVDYWKSAEGQREKEKIRKNATKPSKIPTKGAVIDGYEFLGGDPSKEESWKKK